MRTRRLRVRLLLVLAFLSLGATLLGGAARANSPDPDRGTAGESTYKNPPSPICSTATSSAANVNTSCEPLRQNETAIAVNPRDPTNMIESSNDYQYRFSTGGSLTLTVYSRAHVTFDGGRTWTEYPIDFSGYTGTGDPSVAFDADGVAYLATLGSANSNNPDVVVSRSSDGGRTWSKPVRVASGSGNLSGTDTFQDHPVLTAWGHGNVLVTWISYLAGPHAVLRTVPMMDSLSRDDGVTWTAPASISGSAGFCSGLSSPTACDQTWGNSPSVSPSGRVLVAFQDTYDYGDGTTNHGRNKYLCVEVDPATGQRIGGPFLIGQAFDGINEQDYPLTPEPRQTLHDSEFRLLSQGNLTADPADPSGKHFAVVWFDDRSAPHPVDPNPYAAITDSDVIVSQTFDGGHTWTPPGAIRLSGDQFMPWAAYDPSGKLRIGFYDRSYDPANHVYGYTLATENAPETLSFSFAPAATALSDPTQGNRFPLGGATVDPSFPYPANFIGDYSGIAVTPGHVVASWTDLRENVCIAGRCGHGQNSYFATMP